MRAIDADKLIDGYRHMGYDPSEHPEESYMEGWCKGFNSAVDHCVHHAIHAPTIEPERKTGKWILHPEQKNIFGGKTIECSKCGDKCLVQFVEKEKYCRNCGAKMEGTE